MKEEGSDTKDALKESERKSRKTSDKLSFHSLPAAGMSNPTAAVSQL